MKQQLPFLFLLFILFSCLSVSLLKAQSEKEKEWTDTKFPSYIERLTYFGERPDWSHDGKKILFVERSFGDVYEIEVATGIIKPLTHHYYHGGYARALYLSNGDILLAGPKDFPTDNWMEARFRLSEAWVLSKELDNPPVRLGEYVWEGPAASRSQLKIAWAQHHGVYPDQPRYWQLWIADIDYSSGKPKIKDQRAVLNNSKGEVKGAVLEPQDFLPGNEDELIFQSSHLGTEVMGLNLKTGELTNYSKSPGSYDEPEGVYPNGQYTLVESDRHNPNGGSIDLYMLKMDSSGTWERITYFNKDGKFKATNGVVSDDGKFIAFMVSPAKNVAGVGQGIYVLDIEKMRQLRERN